MTPDERTIVEWALWNVRACDLPGEVAAACHRVAATGTFPRPQQTGQYEPVIARVTAFPRDERLPLRSRMATRPHLAATFTDLFDDDVAYVLATIEAPPSAGG